MGLLDGILGQIGGSDQVAGLAGKLVDISDDAGGNSFRKQVLRHPALQQLLHLRKFGKGRKNRQRHGGQGHQRGNGGKG